MTEEPEAELADDDPVGDEAVAEETEAPTADDAADADGLQEGDFVKLDYSIRTVEDGSLVDTTDLETAEEDGLETEDRDFGPRTVVLGAGHVFAAVEEDIYGREVGESGSVQVPAVDAFGEHDSEQVRTVSADKIPEDQRYPGAHVNVDGQHGHVETVIGGRARVDFNHPLAGQDIEYEYEIVSGVEDRIERAKGLLSMYVDAELDMSIETDEEEEPAFDEEGEEAGTEIVELETLYIEATPQLAMNQQWLFSKQQIAQELIDRVGVDRVIVEEVLDGSGGFGGLGGMGGMGGLEEGDLDEAVDEADLEDVDADDIVEELEAGSALEPEDAEE